MRVLTQIGLVALGSALGGVTRWGVGLAIARVFGTRFPVGTFFINVTGCLFLGWFMTVLSERLVQPPDSWLSADDLRLLLGVGFAGGYTTFSTFEWETYKLVRDRSYGLALANVFGSVAAGFAGVLIAVFLLRLIFPRS